MSLDSDVAALTRVTTQLLSEVNVTSSSLSDKATTADNEATSAAAHATSAEGYKDQALGHRSSVSYYLRATSDQVSYAGLPAGATDSIVTNDIADIFIYDTTKDLDGGAWRERTQHTSWYNETLNTSTRGATKKFPAVAVIVAESSKVTIYDGDDPSLPMWSILTGAVRPFGNSLADTIWINNGNTSVTAQNGMILLGANGSTAPSNGGGLYIFSFVEDAATQRWSSYGGNTGYQANPLTDVIAGTKATHGLPAIIDANVNDVAITVLPDAPIDDTTGLPVPTIAVATDDGVSVIKDDGNVWDITNSHNTINKVFDVSFFGSSLFFSQGFRSGDSYPKMRVIRDISTLTADTEITNNQTTGTGIDLDANYGTQDLGPNLGIGSTQNWRASEPLSSSSFAFSIEAGGAFVTSIRHEDTTTPDNGMVAFITSTYNTGWMNGDIKGAFLADTDDTNFVGGTEYVVDGGFDDATKWTADGDSTVSGGVLNVADGTANEIIYNSGATTYFPKDKQAIVTFTISNSSANFGVRVCLIRPSNGSNMSTNGGTYYTADGTYNVTTLSPPAHDWVIGFQRIGNHTGTLQIDNISVRQAESDRSHNQNSLIGNGTITKDPVATGAELVSYSGFSPTNYLQQPYNSDLDFGTGDFCVMGWVKESAASDWIVDRMEGRDGSSNLWGFNVWQNTQSLRFDVYENNANTTVTSTTVMGNNDGVWYFFAAVRRSGVLEMYMQGSLEATTSGTARNISYTSTGNAPPLIIGGRNTVPVGASWTNGKAALIRISATAPSAEQIKKIYNDERKLFHENAACTLYGVNNEVKALAYDDDTDLLHLGTGSGRSVFKGLTRVDSNTTAVADVIAASGGLIVES